MQRVHRAARGATSIEGSGTLNYLTDPDGTILTDSDGNPLLDGDGT